MTTPSAASAPHAAPSSTGTARVLLPRPAGRAGGLALLLEEAGLQVEHHPFVELHLHDDPPLREAVRGLGAGEFDHLVLTSPRAVEALQAADMLRAVDQHGAGQAPESAGSRLQIPDTTIVTVVGEGTASALRAVDREPDRTASGSGAALVAEFPEAVVATGAPVDAAATGTRVLFPASAAAAPTVPEGLAAKGYRVTQVQAYSPHRADLAPRVQTDLSTGEYAAVVLTSSMIARIAAEVGVHASTRVVTIGDPTTAAARDAGLTVHAQAAAPTDQALADAVLHALRPADDDPAVSTVPAADPAASDPTAADPQEDPS